MKLRHLIRAAQSAAHLLAAARSRHGSDSPPDCHSLPCRHCATLKGKADKKSDTICFERVLLLRGSCHSLSVTEGVKLYQALTSPKGQQERLEIFSRCSCKGDKNKLYSLIRYNRSGTIGSDNGDFNGHIFRNG